MLGTWVAVPLNHADWVEGNVVQHSEDTGVITVEGEDGNMYTGHEYQCEVLILPKKEAPDESR